MKKMNKTGMIKLISELLLHMQNSGWEPLTPITIGDRDKKMAVTICFKHLESVPPNQKCSVPQSMDVPQRVSTCSIEISGRLMMFYNVPATVLADILITFSSELAGVSAGVVSVLSDYISLEVPVISVPSVFVEFKPNSSALRNLSDKSDVIACLSNAGYRLSIVINLSDSDSVFFFIIDSHRSKDVRQLTKQVAGLGLRDSLTYFQPIVKRRKSSFFRSFNNRESLKRRLQKSMKRKFGHNKGKVEWYQQTSTDIGTDCEYEDIELEDLQAKKLTD